MPQSDNHGLNVPSEDTLDWSGLLNENWRDLDRKVEIRDTDANKSNYEPEDTAVYRATDTGAIYLGDGTSWAPLSICADTVSAATLVHLDPQGSEPPSPSIGDVALADGTNWDPDGDGTAETVIYNGTEWIEDTDLDTSL